MDLIKPKELALFVSIFVVSLLSASLTFGAEENKQAEGRGALVHGISEGVQHGVSAGLMLLGGGFLLYTIYNVLWPGDKSPRTEVHFLDLRRGSFLSEDREISGQATSELIAARLQHILRIHDLAYQNFYKYFEDREIIDNDTYSHVTAILHRFDIQPLLIEDPIHLVIGSTLMQPDLGQITANTGIVDAKFSLDRLQKLLGKNRSNINRLTGSLQSYAGQTRLVGMLENRGKTWGWIIDPEDIQNFA